MSNNRIIFLFLLTFFISSVLFVSCFSDVDFNGDLKNDLQDIYSVDVKLNYDDAQTTIKLEIEKEFSNTALIQYYLNSLSYVKPGYYPSKWEFQGFLQDNIPEGTKESFVTEDDQGSISSIIIPPYPFSIKLSDWQTRTDTKFTVKFLFESETEGEYISNSSAPDALLASVTNSSIDETFAAVCAANINIPGFEYEKYESNSTIIKEDGSTVITIYFKRKTVTYIFYYSDVEPYTSVNQVITIRYGVSTSSIEPPAHTSSNNYPIIGWSPSIPETATEDMEFTPIIIDGSKYYVDPSAEKSGEGTFENPFRSITELNEYIVSNPSLSSVSNATVYLFNSITAAEELTKLPANIKTISRVNKSEDNKVFDFSIISLTSGEVTVSDRIFDGGAQWTNTEDPASFIESSSNTGCTSTVPLITLDGSTTSITFTNCELKNNANTSNSVLGGSLSLSNGAKCTANNSTFTQNYSHKGGAVYINNSYFESTNTNFTSNSANTGGGGAVHIPYYSGSSSTTNITGGEFSNNYSHGSGGAVYCNASGITNTQLIGVTLKNNVSKTNGAGIFVSSGRFIVLDDLEFDNNKYTDDSLNDLYVSGTAYLKTNISDANIYLGTENAILRIQSGFNVTSQVNLKIIEANVDKQIIHEVTESGTETIIDVSPISSAIINMFNVDSAYYIDSQGYLRTAFQTGIGIDTSEITIGSLSSSVFSLSSNNSLTFTFTQEALSAEPDIADYTFTLYYAEDNKTYPLTVSEQDIDSREYSISLSSGTDRPSEVGLYTLIIEVIDSSLNISPFTQKVTVNY